MEEADPNAHCLPHGTYRKSLRHCRKADPAGRNGKSVAGASESTCLGYIPSDWMIKGRWVDDRSAELGG